MSDSPFGKHAHRSSSPEPPVPEPTYAERARTLVAGKRLGSLATMSRKRPDWPFASVMPYGLDEKGQPIFLISSMAMHTQNVLGDPRAALLVSEAKSEDDALGAGRVTLMGSVTQAPEDQKPRARELYLSRYENAKHWVDYEDFAFYLMNVIDVYFVGGFGVMGWVSAEDYLAAEPDPLAGAAERILSHMNEDHGEAMIALAKARAGIHALAARMTAVDRLGFHLRLETAEGMKGVRIAFGQEVRSPEEVRRELVEMVKRARAS